MRPVVLQALEQARKGEVEGALKTLRASQDALDVDGLAMVYLFVEEDPQPALEVCTMALEASPEAALSPALTSTWRLRRGRQHGLLGHRDAAMRDYLKVIQLQVSTEQVQEANRAMLKLAGA